MKKDQTARMIFGEALSQALVSTTPEVMAVPCSARPQESGFIMVTFQDCGSGDVVLSSIGLSAGAETQAYDDVTIDCATYATPVVIFPFDPSKHALFSGPTVTLTFTPTGTLGSAPFALATVVEFPVDGPKPATLLGAQIAAIS